MPRSGWFCRTTPSHTSTSLRKSPGQTCSHHPRRSTSEPAMASSVATLASDREVFLPTRAARTGRRSLHPCPPTSLRWRMKPAQRLYQPHVGRAMVQVPPSVPIFDVYRVTRKPPREVRKAEYVESQQHLEAALGSSAPFLSQTLHMYTSLPSACISCARVSSFARHVFTSVCVCVEA